MGRPTIIDVARRAGVSKSLVSLVLQDAPNVSEEKRTAVLQALRELDYRPNAMARSLALQRTNVVGVMLSDLHNTFFADVLDGIDEGAAERGFMTLVNTGHRSAQREAEAIDTLLELRIDGLILASPLVGLETMLEASRFVPVVVVGRPMDSDRIDTVTNDDRAGAAMMVEHLAGLGHRRISHIDGGDGAGARERRDGYEAAMRARGLGEHTRVASGSFTEAGGASGLEQLLADSIPPTAVFAANDLAAMGALNGLDDRGLRVPADLSLAGYDDTALARLRHISLTTVAQPRKEMGIRALELLLERIDGRDEAEHVTLRPALVVRESTGACAEATEARSGS